MSNKSVVIQISVRGSGSGEDNQVTEEVIDTTSDKDLQRVLYIIKGGIEQTLENVVNNRAVISL